MKSRLWLRISRTMLLPPALMLLSLIFIWILRVGMGPGLDQNTGIGKNGAGGKAGAVMAAVIANDELQNVYANLAIAKLATPRAADSRPDLSGVWLNPFPAVAEKSENGT